MQKDKQEVEGRQRSKSRSRPLKALEKRLPKGVGVIIEIQGGASQDYEELVKEYERVIPLKEIGVPSIDIRKTRSGGILMGIKGQQEKEKADLLASHIKEVIKKKEGAKVWFLKKRIRLRLTGLPPGARAEEIAAAVAKEGGGTADRVTGGPASDVDVRGGHHLGGLPKRGGGAGGGSTRAYHGVGPGGGFPSGKEGSPMPGARAPRAVVPLGNRPRGLLPGVRR